MGRKENLPRLSSASDGLSRASMFSSQSFNTMVSRVPDLQPFVLMNLANAIYKCRSALVELTTKSRSGRSLRDRLSSSEMTKLFVKSGIRITAGETKAVLKELGFNWNGPAASLQQLLGRLR
jgi:hypothetical protein